MNALMSVQRRYQRCAVHHGGWGVAALQSTGDYAAVCRHNISCLSHRNMSWAAIAKRDAPAPQVQENKPAPQGSRIAVVDANAIISGLRLDSVADRFCTIQEVLDECRDKQSRQFLASLPYTIEVKEPTEEDVKAGTN